MVKSDEIAVFTYSYDWSGIMNSDRISGAGRGTSSLVNVDGASLLATEHLGQKTGE